MYKEVRWGWVWGDVSDIAWMAAGVASGCAILAVAAYIGPLHPTPARLASTVKVELSKSHGSGVHIGNGLIVSAAHVASEGDTVKIRTDDGSLREATVIWASKAHDIALLQTSSDGMAESPLSCAPSAIGLPVHAVGNPLSFDGITMNGRVAGKPRKAQDWASVVPLDITILPGMSGGPVFNDAGEVVGISVAVATAPVGFSFSLTGLGMMVPSTVVCGLLGRV
jgi:S1-C subfamily serine protease